jgi:hypothetical protein
VRCFKQIGAAAVRRSEGNYARALGRVRASLAPLAAFAALTRPARSGVVGNYRSDAEYLPLKHGRHVAHTEVMRIWLDLPDNFVEQLGDKGQDLSSGPRSRRNEWVSNEPA